MFTDAARNLYYESIPLAHHQIATVEQMRLSSPARKVGQHALQNVVTFLQSQLNKGLRALESFTVEALHALQIELLTDTHEYYTQVPLQGVERTINGRRHVSSAKLDKLLLTPRGIRLIEDKTLERVQKEAEERPNDWKQMDGVWTHIPYKQWAEEHGFEFELWMPPAIPSINLANLLVLFDFKAAPLSKSAARVGGVLLHRLKEKPLTITEAVANIRGITPDIVAQLLAHRVVHGTLQSRTLTNQEGFLLFSDAGRAEATDAQLLAALAAKFEQQETFNPVLRATTTDYRAGKNRLARVNRIRAGEEPMTRRYKPIVRAVEKSLLEGSNPLVPCLTRYENSGNAEPRLHPNQYVAMTRTFDKHWDTGAVVFKNDLHIKLEEEAKLLSTKPPSETTMKTYLKAHLQQKHHLNTGGRKQFHANENPVDVMKATMPALLPGLYMHVDATKLDSRLSPSVLAALPFDCPTLYVAVDSCTADPVGRALVFGPQARDPLGILLRDILCRQKRLHRFLMHDGGSEYQVWFYGFCSAVGMSLIKPPVGEPRKNGRVENALGRTNQLLSHRLLGSTKPDQAGRKVDNRFKSYHTARLLFGDVLKEIDQLLFEDMPATPTGNSSPSNRRRRHVRSVRRRNDITTLSSSGRPAARTAAW